MELDGKELVITTIDDRNWKGIGISLVVIVSIFSLIGLAIFLLTPASQPNDYGIYKLNIKDLVGNQYKPDSFHGNWISETEFIHKDQNGSIMLYSIKNQNVTKQLLVHSSILRQLNVQKYSLSDDRKFILLISGGKKDLDLSFVITFTVYDILNHVILYPAEILKDSSISKKIDDIQAIKWGPSGNSLIIIKANNIYYVFGIGQPAVKVTETGIPGIIYNGIGDWLYSNHVFGFESPCAWISADGKYLVYATFNDTLVSKHPIKYYGTTVQSIDLSAKVNIPQIYTQRYPRAGQKNPNVTLSWIEIDSLKNSDHQVNQIQSTKLIDELDCYLTAVHWNKDELIVSWTTRQQNLTIITSCSTVNKWTCNELLSYPSFPLQLNEISNTLLHTVNTEINFLRRPRPDSIIGTYYQISVFNWKNKYSQFITDEEYDVMKLLSYNAETRSLYYQATGDKKPEQRHIYRLRFNDDHKGKYIDCLTCELIDECKHYEAYFSSNQRYYILECLGTRIGDAYLWIDGQQKINLIDNDELKEKLQLKRLPIIRTFSFSVDNKFVATAKLLIPPPKEFKSKEEEEDDEDELIRYPLVLNSISQEEQSIDSRFNIDWGTYLSSNKEYIHAQIQVRPKYSREVKVNRLATEKYNAQNVQLRVLRMLIKEVEEIDPRKIAIWGTGVSAYLALSSIIIDNENLLKCAIAISPVTNWRYLDSISAEYRYGSPSINENYATYETISLINKTPNLRNRKFLLVHGTADDLIHVQHTMLLTKALVNSHVQDGTYIKYQVQLYPDDDHYVSLSRLHFYQLMENYLEKCFTRIKLKSAT